MWKKENESRPEPAPQTGAPAPAPRASSASHASQAVIGPSIRVKGSLHGQEDLLIQGSVEGKVELDKNQVTVGSQGKVKADIVGRVIVVEGSVEGNLFGSEQVLLSSSSSVRGNITAPRVSLDDGANFKGAIDMSSGSASNTPTNPSKKQRNRDKGKHGQQAAAQHGGPQPGGPAQPGGGGPAGGGAHGRGPGG